ncbi:MAG: serine/threonine protein kinase [Planctomycetaceae bacterium]|nr:serine/threonine protein kinase [Planctomycetaceae bacterium]
MDCSTPENLKRFLITSRLVHPEKWEQVMLEVGNSATADQIMQTLERRGELTSLQVNRIQKGDTDGLVLGRYKLMYRNASGSFARVYKAETLDGSETVAVKLLRDRHAADPDAVASFHREARIIQKFQHRNIVPIYDVGNEGRFHYFTMEFVEGGNLRDILRMRQGAPLEPAEAAKCVYEICAGLEYALSMGATHRDLKLTNVLMSSDKVTKLVDFGLAGAESPTQAGTSDDVHRALEYASLERGTNAPRNDPRSDLFFAGAIFYELLCGKPSWARTRDREERKHLSRYTSTPPVETVNPDLPSSLTRIVGRMMQIQPSDRYQTAGEVMSDLRRALVEMGEWEESDDQIEISLGDQAPFRLLIVDTVRKRMRALREYFRKHDFETGFLEHPAAALERLKSFEPPDGVLILADNHTDDVLDIYSQFQAYGRSKKVPCLAVFPADSQDDVERVVRSTRWGATAFQPATVREIRNHFEDIGAITRSV